MKVSFCLRDPHPRRIVHAQTSWDPLLYISHLTLLPLCTTAQYTHLGYTTGIQGYPPHRVYSNKWLIWTSISRSSLLTSYQRTTTQLDYYFIIPKDTSSGVQSVKYSVRIAWYSSLTFNTQLVEHSFDQTFLHPKGLDTRDTNSWVSWSATSFPLTYCVIFVVILAFCYLIIIII